MARPQRRWMLDEGPAPRSRKNVRRSPAAAPVTGGLVPLDSSKLRAQALKALQRAEQAFNQVDRLLKDFEARDLRAFERWKYERMGPQLAELARVAEALNEAEYHLAMADEESERTGLPLRQAFQSWQRREASRHHPPEPETPPGGSRDFFEAFEDQPFEESGEEDEPPLRERRAGRPHQPPPDVKSDLRTRYRQLCRLLHPDAAGEMTPERRAIWHQVQEAYAERDTARLDLLLARLEQGEGLENASRSISELRAMARHLQRAKEKLRQVVADARRHPAWKFLTRDAVDLVQLERSFRRIFMADLHQMERRLALIRDALQPRRRR